MAGCAVYEEVGWLNIGGQHGQQFVLLCHTHSLQKVPYTPFVYAEAQMSNTSADVL